MKRLLNLGVSDPLTLGMAHPVADRLETLGRARPTTWRSRCLALSAMSVIALFTAPLTIAADEPEKSFEIKVMTKGQSYEIVDKNGDKKAYRILKGGEREEADLTKKDDGSYQLTYDDGQVVDVPNIDLAGLEGLKGLRALKSLENLEGLEGLTSLEALEKFEGLDFSGEGFQVFALDGTEINISEGSGFMGNFKDMIASNDGPKEIRIVRSGDATKWLGKGHEIFKWVSEGHENDEVFKLDDTVVNSQFEFFQSSDPLETARRQLERTKRQLESLSDNESVSFDLKNALRDIESAQHSLEEAEKRLLDLEK